MRDARGALDPDTRAEQPHLHARYAPPSSRAALGRNKMNEVHFSFLMRGPKKMPRTTRSTWLPNSAWQACQALGDLEEFGKFCSDLVEAAPRFREWYNHVTPETEKLPLDWASLDRTPFQKMLVVRCLRPDRMTTRI